MIRSSPNVTAIKEASSIISGQVELVAGSNITLTPSGQQITIASTGGGVTSITGTAHQIIASASTGAVTLSTPQDIDTVSAPTFAGLQLNGAGSFTLKINSVTTSTQENITADSNIFQSFLQNHSNNTSQPAQLGFFRSEGTGAAPTKTLVGDALGFESFYGYSGNSGVGYLIAAQAQYWICADGTSTGTSSMPGRIQFFVVQDQQTSLTEMLRMNCKNISNFYSDLQVSGGSTSQFSVQPVTPVSNPPYVWVFDRAVTNLCTNPSFETDTVGSAPASWVAGTNTTLTVVNSAGNFYTGLQAMHVVVSPAAAGGAKFSFAATSGSVYVVSCWIKNTAAGTFGNIQIQGDGTVLPNSAASQNVTNTQWCRIVASWTAISTGTATIKIGSTAAVTQDFYVDGVQIELDPTGVGNCTTYADGSLGRGYSWTGTAHASSSQRLAGHHVLAVPDTTSGIGMGVDRMGHASNTNRWVQNSDFSYGTGGAYEFSSYQPTLNSTTSADVNLGGTLKVINTGAGSAFIASSAATTDIGAVISVQSLTSGTGLSLAINADKSSFTGEYFKFTSKSSTDQGDYRWSKVRYQIGTQNENLNKYFQWYGGGGYSKSNSAVSGSGANTISQSGTTVTGTGTTFTNMVVGDIFVPATGAETVITAIASATSMTVQTSQTIAGGTSFQKATAQYSPAMLFMEEPGGDHRTAKVPTLVSGFFFDSNTHPRNMMPNVLTGTSTLTTTSGSSAFTTAANDAQIAVGDWIYCGTTANNMSPRQVLAYSGTSGTFRGTADASVSGIAYRIRKSGQFTYPTGDTDSMARYFCHEFYKETNGKTCTNNTSEQSWFNTAQVIPGGAFSTWRTLRMRAWGTYKAASTSSTLTLRVKLGGTTIASNTAVTAPTATIQNFFFDCAVQANGASNQNVSFRFSGLTDAASPTGTSIVNAAQSTVNTAQDQTFDVSYQAGTANGQCIIFGLELYWE